MTKGRFAVLPLLLIATILIMAMPAMCGNEDPGFGSLIHGGGGDSSVRTIGVEEFLTASMSCNPSFISAWIAMNEARLGHEARPSWIYSTTLWGCDSKIRGSISATEKTGARVTLSYECNNGIEEHVQLGRLDIEIPLSIFADAVKKTASGSALTKFHLMQARLARIEGEAVADAFECLRRAQIAFAEGDVGEAQKAGKELSLKLGCDGGEEILEAVRVEELDCVRKMISTVVNSDVEMLCSEWIRRDPNVLEAMMDHATQPKRGMAELLPATLLVAQAERSIATSNGSYAFGFALDGSRIRPAVGGSLEAFEARVEAEHTRSTMDFLKLFEEVVEAEAVCEYLYGVDGMEADFIKAVLRLEQNGLRLIAGIGMLPYSYAEDPNRVPAWRILY